MHQYFCIKCKEPVSKEFDKPALEDGVIIACEQCVSDWLLSSTETAFIDLTDFPLSLLTHSQKRRQQHE